MFSREFTIMPNEPEFGMFDPTQELLIAYDEMPHWFQPGVVIFITFRTIDSVPRAVLLRMDYQRQKSIMWHNELDSCHGECVLKRPDLSEIVMDSICRFDGQRYDLDRVIVMPNHVHLLAQFYTGVVCTKQCESWLKFTATRINKALGRKGHFWQSEPFDHLVRSVEQFQYLRRYVQNNGVSANLNPDEYRYWDRSMK